MNAGFRQNRDDDDRIENLRVPPQSVESEQAVLGGLMLAPKALVDICDWVAPEDFYRRDHRLIYTAIRELALKSQPFDVVTLGDWFEANALSSEIGGGAYLIELASTTPSAANIVAYAEIVVGKARLRKAIDIGTKLASDAFQPNGREVSDIVLSAHADLMQLAPTPRTGPKAAKTVLTALYEDLQRRYAAKSMPGQASPWIDLDAITHGWQDSEIVLLAATTNTGKSLAGFQAAAFTALAGNRTLIFSLEMSAEAVMRRTVAAQMSIPHEWLLVPKDSDNPDDPDYWPKVTEAFRKLKDAPLLIDDTPMLSATQIVARAKRAHMQAPVRMVLVDHLHDMALPGKQGEVIERAMAVRELKALSKALGCPVILLAQLNRKSTEEKRRPSKADLRGSGGIEEVADVVLLLHAPEDAPGLIEVIVAKGRDIRTGEIVELAARKNFMRLDNWSGERPDRSTPALKQHKSRFKPNQRSGQMAAAGDA